MVQGISFGITSQYISNYPRKDLRSQRMVDFCTTRGGAYDPIIHLITYIHCTLDSFGFDYPRLKKRIIKMYYKLYSSKWFEQEGNM